MRLGGEDNNLKENPHKCYWDQGCQVTQATSFPGSFLYAKTRNEVDHLSFGTKTLTMLFVFLCICLSFVFFYLLDYTNDWLFGCQP